MGQKFFSQIPAVDPTALPGPEPLFHGLLVATFFLHALFINFVLGGTPIMLVTDWMGYWTNRDHYRRLSTTLANWLPSIMALAVVLGVAPLLFIQTLYGQFFYTATILIGNVWISVIVALIVGYYGLYAYKYSDKWLFERIRLRYAIGLGSTILFVGVALVFVTVSVLMLNPDQWERIQSGGFAQAVMLPSVLPRWFHMVLAAIAGTGILLVLYGSYLGSGNARRRNEDWSTDEEYSTWTIRYGVAWTLGGTLPQIVIGPWLLLSLPMAVRSELISGENIGSLAFFVSLTFALLSLVLLNAALMLPRTRVMALSGVVCLMLTVSLMVVVRDSVRRFWLSDHFDPQQLPTNPQWDAIAMVGVLLIIGVLLGWNVVRAYWKSKLRGSS